MVITNYNLPDEEFWKAPVANVGALPTTDNTEGDVRLAISSGELYYWNGSSWVLASGSGGGGGGGNGYFPQGF